RTSVSSISVTVIRPGAGCSIISAATVSTTGATGGFTFRATFFTGARLGLALATVRFTALAALRALGRFAEFALLSLALLCTFDPFFRLATNRLPCLRWCLHALTQHGQVPATKQSSYQQIVLCVAAPRRCTWPNDHHVRPSSLRFIPTIAKWLTTTTKSIHAYRTAAKLTSTWTRPFVPACVRLLRQGL